MNIGVIILAGGKSIRMGGSIPKPFLPLKGRLVIDYSLDLFFSFPHVVVAPETHHSLLPKHTRLARPGARRQDSVKNGFAVLGTAFDFILIHDGARPLVKAHDIKKLVELGKDHPAAAMANPVVHTLRRASTLGTVDRKDLWEVYTPQMIRTDLLTLGLQTELTVTDDLSLVEALGYKPLLVPSSFPNIKLTYPSDLPFIEALL